jgi:hypothetical protein
VSILLIAEDGRDLKMNAWNWGVLHHMVERAGLFADEVWEPIRHGGGELDAAGVAQLAEFLAHQLLPRLAPGQRMFFAGTVTDEPDDGTFYREESEMWRNYSLLHDVLVGAIEFLRSVPGTLRFS